MQASEFEKNIQSKMEGFELVPSGKVWEQVSDRIGAEKKRRRLIIFWFFAALVLLAGGAGWLATNNQPGNRSKGQPVLVNNNSLAPGKASAVNETLSINKDLVQEDITKNQKKSVGDASDFLKPAPGQDKEMKAVLQNSVAKTAFIKRSLSTGIASYKPTSTQPESVMKSQQNSIANTDQMTTSAPEVITSGYTVLPVPDSTASVAGLTNQLRTKDTSLPLVAPGKALAKTRQTTKRWKVGLTVYAGLSDNVSGFPGISSEDKSASYDVANSNATQGSVASSIRPLNYTSGFSFGFGVFVSRQISNRIQISAGIDYHQYTAKSSVGNRNGSRNAIFDSVLSQYIYSLNFYGNGNSTVFSNTYRSIELPVNVAFRVNRNQNKPFLVTAGVSPAYNISSTALYANSNVSSYYVNKEQFKSFRFSLQAGFLYTLATTKKIGFAIGPVIQYGTTNLTRSSASTRPQHLFFTGIKTTISLK